MLRAIVVCVVRGRYEWSVLLLFLAAMTLPQTHIETRQHLLRFSLGAFDHDIHISKAPISMILVPNLLSLLVEYTLEGILEHSPVSATPAHDSLGIVLAIIAARNVVVVFIDCFPNLGG